ncbi:hypothetical protein GWK48_00870 [Metallosphaera tengchongensis]|uniref:Uncharacterized protein n=1 Tax=Metallosphaera tengchongensis TaxID=1532350 RepID=A0A6N0NTH3_9CREN|nr:hypothetical protein [Metallosphaera tengchongensis]QKQ99138.1 hypothetical protein GWK48_00870 [Metallosphaera tengchongensis]
MVVVSFEDGRRYTLEPDGTVRVGGEAPSVVIASQNNLNEEKLKEYAKNGMKVFLCEGSEVECISLLLNKLFPQCKSCKFM